MGKYSLTISSPNCNGPLSLVTSSGLDRLVSAENLDALESKLARAKVIDPEPPDDVVTTKANVGFRDLDSDESEYTFVYPLEADVSGRVYVMNDADELIGVASTKDVLRHLFVGTECQRV
jgi:hypothetical protein